MIPVEGGRGGAGSGSYSKISLDSCSGHSKTQMFRILSVYDENKKFDLLLSPPLPVWVGGSGSYEKKNRFRFVFRTLENPLVPKFIKYNGNKTFEISAPPLPQRGMGGMGKEDWVIQKD